MAGEQAVPRALGDGISILGAMGRLVFHLALPVRDLPASRAFYVDVLRAEVGRETDTWIDVAFFGHQITLHERPDEVSESEGDVPHFGVILPWADWEELGRRLVDQGAAFFREPRVLFAGTGKEQAKLYLRDPSGHVIEIKAYRSLGDAGLGWIDGGAEDGSN